MCIMSHIKILIIIHRPKKKTRATIIVDPFEGRLLHKIHINNEFFLINYQSKNEKPFLNYENYVWAEEKRNYHN
jgi:hypothetical protein